MHDASSATRPTTIGRTGRRRFGRALRAPSRLLALLVGSLLVGFPASLSAQDADVGERSPVGVEDYGKWERLGGATLSPDGAWIAYGVDRVEEDDELRIRPLGSADGSGTAGDSVVTITHGESPSFSEDDRWLAYLVTTGEDEAEAAREREEPVRDDLGLMDLSSGDTTLVPGVRDFSFSDDGRFLAMARYGPSERDPEGEGPQGIDLVVRDLIDGTDTRFGNVASHAWQDEGSLLAMTIDAEGKVGNGIRVYDPTTGNLRTLESRTARFTGLAWREDADDLAALRKRAGEGREDSTHVILAWRDLTDGTPDASVFDQREHDGFTDSLRVVDYRLPTWSEDGQTLYFGVRTWDEAPVEDEEGVSEDTADADDPPEASTGEDAEDDEEPADVEIWHADDVDIVPRQKVTRQQDERENHLAAWHVDGSSWVRLGTELTEDVEVVEGTGLALGFDATPYEPDRMFGPEYRDVYVIDVETGERDRALERVQYFYGASPGGEHLLYLKDDRYWSHHVPTGRTTDLTGDLPTSFVDLEDDHTVEQKPPFGAAGWLEDGEAVLLYDRHDVWRVSPDGEQAVRITSGAADSVEHRWIQLDEEDDEPGIDPTAPLYFRLYHEWREASGVARLEPGADQPDRLLWMEKQVGGLEKAVDAEVYVWRQEAWGDSPDLFVAGPELADPAQVTRTNPFHDDYAWGDAELVSFENTRGEPLQGALFYPADYEPGERYPMIVYIYETVSPSVRSYSVPSRTSLYNTAIFTAAGYFVFRPDIVYRDRNPGLSAVEALEPAVREVLATGRVDSTRVGLVGHSWGGYQTAFTVTRTDIFAAAVAGAPLTNLVSMYNSVYWRTGNTDARIFEISQGRMEVPPWEDMDAYVDNSPLHQVADMDTPLLVAHGTDDGAVEFNQGVEFYNAARRAGKDLVFLVYNDEDHGMSRDEASQRDLHDRVLEWFGYHLQGEEGPAWITDGVPYLEQMEARQDGGGGG